MGPAALTIAAPAVTVETPQSTAAHSAVRPGIDAIKFSVVGIAKVAKPRKRFSSIYPSASLLRGLR
jgi:hypothetical protein